MISSTNRADLIFLFTLARPWVSSRSRSLSPSYVGINFNTQKIALRGLRVSCVINGLAILSASLDKGRFARVRLDMFRKTLIYGVYNATSLIPQVCLPFNLPLSKNNINKQARLFSLVEYLKVHALNPSITKASISPRRQFSSISRNKTYNRSFIQRSPNHTPQA